MKITNICGFKRINNYVDYKINLLEKSDKTMKALFLLMFSERDNVFFEETDGFRIKKTKYGEIFDLIESKAPYIKEAIGAEPQSIVGLYMENSPDWIVTFWGILCAGYRPILLNTRFDDKKIEAILRDINAKAVISDGKMFSVQTIKYGDINISNKKLEDVEFGNEIYLLSSGTESIKICSYSATELIEIIRNSKYVLKYNKRIKKHYNGELKLLAFLPFYHIFGFVAVYLWFGFFSRTFVKLNDLKPLTIQNTIRKHHVTHIFAVPLFWNTVYKQAIKTIQDQGEQTYKRFLTGLKISNRLGNSFVGKIFAKKCLKEVRDNLFGSSVNFMITGGSSIDGEVLKFFNGIGYYLVNGYGMSEIGITSVELSEKRKRIVNSSIGLPFPSVKYKIENNILYVKGRSVAKYIIANGKKFEFNDEWYRTSDLATMENGYYKLHGRSDDLIISVTGENLNPVRIEELLISTDVNGVCLIGGRDGNLPVLLVSVDKRTSAQVVEMVMLTIKQKIAEHNLTAQVGKIALITSDLIVGNEFKLNRKRLANDYYNGNLALWSNDQKEKSMDVDELTMKVRSYFAIALNKQETEIGLDTDFFMDEGGTSLDYFALISKLQDDYSVDFPTSMGNSLNTVRDIAGYLNGKR